MRGSVFVYVYLAELFRNVTRIQLVWSRCTHSKTKEYQQEQQQQFGAFSVMQVHLCTYVLRSVFFLFTCSVSALSMFERHKNTTVSDRYQMKCLQMFIFMGNFRLD